MECCIFEVSGWAESAQIVAVPKSMRIRPAATQHVWVVVPCWKNQRLFPMLLSKKTRAVVIRLSVKSFSFSLCPENHKFRDLSETKLGKVAVGNQKLKIFSIGNSCFCYLKFFIIPFFF